MHSEYLECTSNAPGMPTEYGSNVQEFKQNAAQILRMYMYFKLFRRDGIRSAFQLNFLNIEIDSGSNRNAFEVHSGSFEALSGHSGRI